ncbi:hypothetical protein E3U44_10970 [Nitrosococcus wardiae]|uniref:Cupin type-1 domain-containing protein n=1 Tax=Nitrosococcus wardiae TaxID=1814290 RepID=A0A4P7C036_9GAMM|nr:hypothetical protein E3U44_10970 [Nitrosococcus wardiae]
MESFWLNSLALEMSSEHKVVHLHPGSVFYLPSGFWHATHATAQESILLNTVFPQIARADVFLRLGSVLNSRPVILGKAY